jgi:hypothetical protein
MFIFILHITMYVNGMFDVDNFFFRQQGKIRIKHDINQSCSRELLLCKVIYAGWGEGWLLVYDHRSCILLLIIIYCFLRNGESHKFQNASCLFVIYQTFLCSTGILVGTGRYLSRYSTKKKY